MAERDVTIKLNLKPGDVSQIGDWMSRLGKAGKETEKSFRASEQMMEGMRRAGREADAERISKLPEALPTGLQAFFGGGGLGKNIQQAGLGYTAQKIGGVLGGAGGGALSLAGSALTAGAAGFAAGGPIGALIAMAPHALEAIKKVASAPFEMVGKGFQTLTKGMQDLAGPLGPGGVVFTGLSNAVKQIPLVGDAFAGMVDSIRGFLEQGVDFVRLFSPGTSERFGIVQQDTLATIGRTFTPVLEALTDFMRLVGDFLATVLPGVGEMRDALSPLKDIFSEMRSILSDLAPILQTVVGVGLLELKGALIALDLALKLNPFLNVLRLIGEMMGGGGALASSNNMAARNISFTTQEQGAKQVYQAAFRGGVPTHTSENYLQKLLEGFTNGTFVIKILEHIAEQGGNVAAGTGRAVAGPFGEVFVRGVIGGAR